MSHDADAECRCVAVHRPPYLELERHHVQPRYLGGPDVEDNLIWICATTHDSVHELLRLMLGAGRRLTYHECQQAEPRPVAYYAWELALRGYDRWRTSVETTGEGRTP